MCAKFSGIPALIYSGLWRRQIFGKLKKDFPHKTTLAVFITDNPPAVLITIEKNTFDMKKLEEIKDINELDSIDCDGYFAAPRGYLYGGAPALMKGVGEGKVKMKNESAIFGIILRNIS
ncbi:hypothetical protein LCGC14_2039080 [marine sediment metagenome]|uniref:Uncharacterized protein n=1 Tax=marine sediment metagenome TaxID=412755 RepID=A0A0F9ESL8_9ZZZZ